MKIATRVDIVKKIKKEEDFMIFEQKEKDYIPMIQEDEQLA